MSRCKDNRFVAVARVLACGLAAVLLVFGLLAANSGFHQAMHQSGETGSHGCVLCLMANGQVDLASTAPVAPAPLQPSFAPVPQRASVALADFTYLLSPSRAPPTVGLLLPVLA